MNENNREFLNRIIRMIPLAVTITVYLAIMFAFKDQGKVTDTMIIGGSAVIILVSSVLYDYDYY